MELTLKKLKKKEEGMISSVVTGSSGNKISIRRVNYVWKPRDRRYTGNRGEDVLLVT